VTELAHCEKQGDFLLEGASDLLCLSSSSALHFSNYNFLVHHPVNWDDRLLLACAMASDFSVAWQFSSMRTIGFSLRIKLNALIRVTRLAHCDQIGYVIESPWFADILLAFSD
jgi:hypothetical protein